MERHEEKISFILKAIFFSVTLILSSCITGMSTRSLPYTTLPLPTPTIEDGVKGLKIALVLFDVKDIKFSGGHYKGLMQINQPWDFMHYQEKKNAFYTGLSETARYAIGDEFIRQGLDVIVTDGKDMNRLKGLDIIITGRITQIEMNTYGHGTKEGFGSIGDYWEAGVILGNVTIYNARDGAILWIGDLEKYCKLPNGPEKLDWTIFEAVSKFLQVSIKEKDYEDYFQKRQDITPVEIAARLSAIDIIKKLKPINQ
ncbi:MAG: hypothetical protein AABZ11_12035 [Nitrospinota bacterium]